MIIFFIVLWAIFFTLHIVAGHLFKLYDKTKWFDLLLHFFAGTLIVVTSLRYIVTGLDGPFLTALFIFCISLSVGTIWEMGEFVTDKIFKTNMQRWQDGKGTGLADSMTDLMAGAFGALAACIIFLIYVVYV